MNLKASVENEDKLMSRMCTSCCVSLRDNRKIRFVWLCRCVRIDISKYVLLRADDESRERFGQKINVEIHSSEVNEAEVFSENVISNNR